MLDMFAKGGLLMWPILLCSIIAFAITIRKIIVFGSSLRVVSLSPEQAAASQPDLLSPILEALRRGEGEKEISAIGTRTVRNLENGLGTLSLISAICPLLGLTGTVIGMIQAFQVIASAGTTVNPGMLASGVWEALLTTAAGLLVAIPVHVAHHYLDARFSDIVTNFQELATGLVAERPHEI